LRRRSAVPSACAAAIPSLPPPLAASPSRTLRLGASCTLNHALELEIEFAGEITAPRRRSPLAAGYCPAAGCLHTSLAAGSRSDAPDSIQPPHLNPQATTTARSRSNRSRSSQPVKPPPALAVLWKTAQVFRYSQKYPSTLESFLQFSPFSFVLAQILFKPLQISPCTFFRP
jgi:hypothetical protein